MCSNLQNTDGDSIDNLALFYGSDVLSELRGWSAQAILWDFINRKALYLHATNEAECQRMKVLMEKYQDIPMDLADASLVAVAESQKIKQLFTLDSDFYVYRLYDKDAFEVIPG